MRTKSCLAPHVPPQQPECEELQWIPPRADERRRVVDWTCDCRRLVYELCESGGQAFIHRTMRHADVTIERQTHRMRPKEARAVWAALLAGQMR
ncbi:hypothetical protein HII36_31345 [Nonomuraea sp. NN258]|uniref:hypothetical protein n=1 Tax=Nonomuraea antri TaxID=2730852 RepID=UPI001567D457|nr:hypothetical protein [Nonomuraea antri]NRQ36296.1 hypothetical protein [Nonomuraea antri]